MLLMGVAREARGLLLGCRGIVELLDTPSNVLADELDMGVRRIGLLIEHASWLLGNAVDAAPKGESL